MDFVSITKPEVISIGNIQPGARIRLYDSNMPTTNSYFIGTSNSSFGIWKDGGTTLVGIGTSTPAYTLDVAGNMNASSLRISGVLTSTVATGTAPFTLASTTLVNNLNAQLLNGQNGAYYLNAGNLTGTLGTLYGGTGATGTTGTGTNVLNGSPTFTGVPLAPTASAGTSNTQIATTQFVQTATSGVLSATNTWTGNNTFNTGTLIANTLTSTTGTRQFYTNAVPTYGEGIFVWSGVSSYTIDISTVFKTEFDYGATNTSVFLQVVTGPSASAGLSGMYNMLRNGTTWTSAGISQVTAGTSTCTLSGSGNVITLTFNGNHYGHAWVRIICQG